MADLLSRINPFEGSDDSNVTPLIAAIPNGTSLGDSILMNSIVSPHPKFLDTISTYAASIPLKNFWIVAFKIPMLIDETNLRFYSEFFDNNNKAKDVLGSERFNSPNNLGVVFCRSVNFVGEKNEADALQVQTRGFRTSPIAGFRSGNFLNSLTLNFYESTVSFIDHIIRPWTVLMSYYSTITRNPKEKITMQVNGAQTRVNTLQATQDLRQDIYCFIFSRAGSAPNKEVRDTVAHNNGAITTYNLPPKLRKTLVFKNCFPTTFGNLSYSHNTRNNEIEAVDTTFSYSNYEIHLGSTFFDINPVTVEPIDAPRPKPQRQTPAPTARPRGSVVIERRQPEFLPTPQHTNNSLNPVDRNTKIREEFRVKLSKE